MDDLATTQVEEPFASTSSEDSVVSGDTLPSEAPDAAHPAGAGFDPRYRPDDLLGVGGMGEVWLCQDTNVGREVAIKVIRRDIRGSRQARARFLREAHIQGRLEHPALVPVHDIGVGPAGEAYFTMKRVRGLALDDILVGLATGKAETVARFSSRKLLAAFAQVCLAVDFAHSRGVVHRDLKPANLMFGDFGEVYVLDWGLAKLVEARDVDPIDVQAPDELGATASGTILGTLGYMAPEQLAGDGDAIDARTDIYALGAILCEILTLRPLHAGKSARDLMRSTVEGTRIADVVRRSGIAVAPELEVVCDRATATDPAQRFETARQLHDAIEAFLEGDRDLERRRAAAAQHAQTSQEAMLRAAADVACEQAERGRAMQEASRALALDPGNELAQRTMLELLTVPLRAPPAEVVEQLEAVSTAATRRGAWEGAAAFGLWLTFVPMGFWMGVRDWTLALIATVCVLASGILTLIATSRPRPRPYFGVVLVLSSAAIILTSRIFGPLLVVPSLATAVASVYAAGPDRLMRLGGTVMGVFTLVASLALELTGIFGHVYTFQDGRLTVAGSIELHSTSMLVTVGLASLALMLVPVLRSRNQVDAMSRAELEVRLRAWQLGWCAPEERTRQQPR